MIFGTCCTRGEKLLGSVAASGGSGEFFRLNYLAVKSIKLITVVPSRFSPQHASMCVRGTYPLTCFYTERNNNNQKTVSKAGNDWNKPKEAIWRIKHTFLSILMCNLCQQLCPGVENVLSSDAIKSRHFFFFLIFFKTSDQAGYSGITITRQVLARPALGLRVLIEALKFSS